MIVAIVLVTRALLQQTFVACRALVIILAIVYDTRVRLDRVAL